MSSAREDNPDGDPFAGFERQFIDTAGATIHARIGGSGPPLLLLHGYPQSHVMWHKVAPALAERFTLVIADLRGYGDSACPPADPFHFNYSKRAMADDCIDVMDALGFEDFRVAGHDRGGRVAYRLALDHPQRINRVAVLDIMPTHAMWHGMDHARAMKVYHWLFLAQPYPFPEAMIMANPVFFLDHTLASWTKTRDLSCFGQAALTAYRAAFTAPERVAASCEDYRAGESYDLRADQEDREAGVKLHCPLQVLWGDAGLPAGGRDLLDIWRDWAVDVDGGPVDAGHFLCEENPHDTQAALLDFMRR